MSNPTIDIYHLESELDNVVAIYKNGVLVYEGEVIMPNLKTVQSLTEGTVFEVSATPLMEERDIFPDDERDISDYVEVKKVMTYKDMLDESAREMKALFNRE